MTESPEILRMNIQYYEGLLRLERNDARRQQIQKLLAETRAELQSSNQPPPPLKG